MRVDSAIRKKVLTTLLAVICIVVFVPYHYLNAQTVPAQDSLALVDLYNSTDGTNWTNSANWLTSNPVSTWENVTVISGRVTELHLYDNNLNGTLPTSIGDLTALTVLDLGLNSLSGTLPVSLGNLTSLYTLYLDDNSFTGDVPNSITSLSSLQNLYLTNNYFTFLPDLSGLSSLTSLYVQGNALEFDDLEANIGINTFSYIPQDSVGRSIDTTGVEGGSISFSVNVGGSANQYQWYKNGTVISGATSSTYTVYGLNSSTSGEYYCKITNSTVTSLTLTSRIVSLSVVTSAVADSLALVELYNSTNGTSWSDNTNWLTSQPLSNWFGVTVSGGRVTQLYLTSNNVSGSLPAEIGNLTALVDLYIDVNNLTGSIPPEIGNLTNLQQIRFFNNELTGAIPAEIGNLTNLTRLDLAINNLSGSIPPELGNLTNLQYLTLYRNNLSGPIPAELGNLSGINNISIYDNALTGALPSEFANLSTLSYLNCRENALTDIPDLSSLTNLNYLYIQNNQLTFEDIEPNLGVASTEYTYAPQDSVLSAQQNVVNSGDNISLSSGVGGTSNQYQWYKDGSPISGATGSDYTISPLDAGHAGEYTCRITNTSASDLTLWRRPVTLEVQTLTPNTASLYVRGSGRAQADDTNPINTGADPSAYQLDGSQMTVEAWVFPMDLPDNGELYNIVVRPYLEDPYIAYSLTIYNLDGNDNPVYSFAISDGTPGNEVRVNAPTSPTVGQWAHVVGVYNGSAVQLYVNGTLVNSVAYSGSIGAGENGFYIGSRLGYRSFYGLIDEVRLWDIARSQTDIQNNMYTTLYGNESSLVGYWPLESETVIDGTVRTAKDVSTSINDLRLFKRAHIVNFPTNTTVEILPEIDVVPLRAVVDNYYEYVPKVYGWPNANLWLDSYPSGMNVSGGAVTWTPGLWQAGSQQFTLWAENTTGSSSQTYQIWVDKYLTQQQDHANQSALTVFNNGVIGKDGGSYGSGFVYNGLNGLYEADLVIGQSRTQVSGGLYVREFSIQDTIKSVTSSLAGFDQSYVTRFSDARAENPLNVTVRQRSHSSTSSPDNDYVVLEYILTNDNGTPLSDVYVGIASDWDVGDSQQNLGNYDGSTRLSYVYESTGSTNPNYYGVTALNGSISGHDLWSIGSGDGRVDSTLYDGMTEFKAVPATAGDIRGVLGTGPYTIQAYDSIRVAFAVVGGSNLDAIKLNAEYARNTYLNATSTMPTVKEQWPTWSGFAAIHDTALVLFDRPLELWTLNGNVYVDSDNYGNIPYTLVHNDSIIGIVPDSPLPAMDNITVTLTNGITDLYGNGLDGNYNGLVDGSPNDDFVWTFQTTAAGDFNRDQFIDFDDLMIFRREWFHSYSQSIADIAPFSGSIPNVQVSPDGQVNFDDLMTLVAMWNWASDNMIKPRADGLLAKQTAEIESPLKLLPVSGSADSDNQVALDVKFTEKRGIAGLSISLQIDPELLEYQSFQPADSLQQNDQWMVLDHYDASSNILTINVINFGTDKKGSGAVSQLGTIHTSVKKRAEVSLQGAVDVRFAGDSLSNYAGKTMVSVNTTQFIPDNYQLQQNYPNPFSTSTFIKYAVPDNAHIRLLIIDLQGRIVQTVYEGAQAPGYYTEVWDGTNWRGLEQSSGLYFLVLETPEKRLRKKIVFVK